MSAVAESPQCVAEMWEECSRDAIVSQLQELLALLAAADWIAGSCGRPSCGEVLAQKPETSANNM